MQDPINRGHGAQYSYRPPPAGAKGEIATSKCLAETDKPLLRVRRTMQGCLNCILGTPFLVMSKFECIRTLGPVTHDRVPAAKVFSSRL